MLKKLCKAILHLFNWNIGPIGEDVPKCVICVAPHTSNWDFIVGKLFYTAIGRNAKFLIKKEWYVFPLNLFFNALGGVPIDRSKRKDGQSASSTTEQMVKEFSKRERFQLAITPEGTRKGTNEWKKGFYYIALEANVPILPAYIDYKRKEAGFMPAFYPTGDAEADIIKIRALYEHVVGKHPEKFITQKA